MISSKFTHHEVYHVELVIIKHEGLNQQTWITASAIKLRTNCNSVQRRLYKSDITLELLDDFTVSPFSGAGEESLLITGWSFESRGNHANLIDSSMWDCKNQPIINKGLPHDSNDQPVINKDSSPAPLNGSNREVAYSNAAQSL